MLCFRKPPILGKQHVEVAYLFVVAVLNLALGYLLGRRILRRTTAQ
jgi:hypothetical protein